MGFVLRECALVHPNGHRALNGITLSAQVGERLAIIGPSGAGKTTLLRVLGSSTRPTGGSVEVLGHQPWALTASALKRLRSRVGTVHQQAPIPPRLRVVTAVLAGRLGQWPLWRSLVSLVYPQDIAGAHEVLGRLGLADRLFDRCDRLSGGQLQRVGIARVLYQSPALMLADEPVSSLDPALSDEALRVLVDAADTSGAGLVASLHAVDLALKWFPRVVGMRAGQVVFDLPRDDVTPEMLRDLYATEGVVPRQAAPLPWQSAAA